MENILRKSYESELQVDEGKREVIAIISTNSVDRDGEVVSPKGMRKKNFAGNPVVMLNHDYQKLPIGKALWVKSDGDKVISKYRVSDATQEARDVFGLLQDGTLNAHSIGFATNYKSKPTTKEINERPELADAKIIHRDWELFEFSVVGIPCNPDALALAVSKGYSKAVIDFLTIPQAVKKGIEEQIVEKVVKEVKTLDRKQLEDLIAQVVANQQISVNIDSAVETALRLLTKE